MPRTRRAAWIVSIAAHGLLLAVALVADRRTVPAPGLPVRLVGSGESRGGPRPILRSPAALRARPRDPRRPVAAGPPAPTRLPPPTPPDDEAAASWKAFDRETVQAWQGHSLVAWLDDCREGRTPRDTLIERERSPEEMAREALSDGLHRDFLRRAAAWEYERFLEAYRRNFPLMR